MDFIFANGITLAHINQHNDALKNQYMDNMLSTAASILPMIESGLNDERIIVKKCFVSNAHMKELGHDVFDNLVQPFTKGLAIEVTWDDFNIETAHLVAHKLYDYCYKNKLLYKIIINVKRKSLTVYRKERKLQIVEKINEKFKIVRE